MFTNKKDKITAKWRKGRRALILIVVLAMTLQMFGAFAFAEEGDSVRIVDTDTSYTTLTEALAAARDGDTIQLLANIDYSAGIKVENKSITFDVNGFILNVTNANGHGLEVGSGGEVRLVDSSGGGKFNVKGGGGSSKHGVYVHSGGKAEVTRADVTGSGYGAWVAGAGSELVVYTHIWSGFYALQAIDGASVTVYGSLNGGGGMCVAGTDTNVTVYGSSSGGGTGIYANGPVTISVKGNVTGGGAGVYLSGGAQVTIDGWIKATSGSFTYIQFADTPVIKKMQPDFEPTSSKDGYFEYNDGRGNNVWVKYFNPALTIFSVTYEPGEHGTFEPQVTRDLEIGADTPAAPEVTGEDGWEFVGWSPAVSDKVTGNNVYVAQWQEVQVPVALTYTVSYEAGGAGVTGLPALDIIEENASYTIPAEIPARDGYSFAGWSASFGDNYQASESFVMPSADVVLTALWTALPEQLEQPEQPTPPAPPTPSVPSTPPAPPASTYGVTYDGNNNSSGFVPVDEGEYLAGDRAMVREAGSLAREGYRFEGWALTATAVVAGYQPGAILAVTADVTLYAVWSAIVVAPAPAPTPAPTPPGVVGGPTKVADRGSITYEKGMVVSQSDLAVAAEKEGISVVTVLGRDIPLSAPSGLLVWALANLLLLSLTVMSFLVAGIRALINRRRNAETKETQGEKSEHRLKFKPGFFAATILIVIISFVLFLITQNTSLPMVVFDVWTVFFTILFVAAVVASVLSFRRAKSEDDEASESSEPCEFVEVYNLS